MPKKASAYLRHSQIFSGPGQIFMRRRLRMRALHLLALPMTFIRQSSPHTHSGARVQHLMLWVLAALVPGLAAQVLAVWAG